MTREGALLFRVVRFAWVVGLLSACGGEAQPTPSPSDGIVLLGPLRSGMSLALARSALLAGAAWEVLSQSELPQCNIDERFIRSEMDYLGHHGVIDLKVTADDLGLESVVFHADDPPAFLRTLEREGVRPHVFSPSLDVGTRLQVWRFNGDVGGVTFADGEVSAAATARVTECLSQ